MNEDIENAIEQIRTISDSIERTKKRSDVVGKMFIILGVVNFMNFILLTISSFLIFTYNEVALIGFGIDALMLLVFYVEFKKLLNKFKDSSNLYFLGFLRLFMFITFILPLILVAAKIFLYYTSDVNPIIVINQSININVIANLVLFLYAIISFTYSRRRFQTGAILMCVTFLLFVLYAQSAGITAEVYIYTMSVPFWSIAFNLIISVGYIILGIYLRSSELSNEY